MTAAVPAREPTEVAVGDRWQWTRELTDYSAADGWSLAYYLVNSQAKITFAATGAGTTYTVDLAPATTAAYAAGGYAWQAVASKSTTDRVVVASGRITLLPNFAVAGVLDQRTSARRIYEGLLALYEGYSAGRGLVQEYEIAGRRMRFHSAEDLITQLEYWRAQVSREDIAADLQAGLGSRRRIYVRVGRA
jgi:hypothetical protein